MAVKGSRTITLAQANQMIDKAGERAMRELVLEVAQRIVRRTPVRSGRARGNWQVSIGGPPTRETGKLDKSGRRTMNLINTQVERWRSGLRLFLVNLVPYINRLEHGWSKQAPQGMIKITTAEIPQLTRMVAQRVRRGVHPRFRRPHFF